MSLLVFSVLRSGPFMGQSRLTLAPASGSVHTSQLSSNVDMAGTWQGSSASQFNLNHSQCVAGTNEFWIWAVYHKTGTELSLKIMTAVTQARALSGFPGLDAVLTDYFVGGKPDPRLSGAQECFRSGSPVSGSCIAAMRETNTHLYITSGFPAQTEDQAHLKSELAARHADEGARFKLLHWVRDPLEVVCSAYVYHLEGSESWCTIIPNDKVGSFFFACDAADSGHNFSLSKPVPSPIACSAARDAIPSLQRNHTSYTDLLGNLSLEVGGLVESWNFWDQQREMALAYGFVSRLPHGFNVDLTDVMHNCTKGFAEMWLSMGVPEGRTLDACVELGCTWTHEGDSDPHATTHVEGADDMKDGLRAYLPTTDWFTEHQAPNRKLMGYV